MEDEIRRHEEITVAAMLNEATKKAIVTNLAPPALPTHLRLNADRYTTYAEMKCQVVSYVDLKMSSQPMDMCIHHVGPHDDCEQVEDSIEYVGWNQTGRGKS